MKDHSNFADIESFSNSVFEQADESIGWVTAPIIHRDKGKICDIRSGVLLRIADMRFLITAGHDMIAHSRGKRIPEIVMPDKGKSTVHLYEETFWTTTSKAEDLTVCQLTEPTTRMLGDRFRYVSLSDFMSLNDQQHGHGLYLLYGFPNQMGSTDDDGTKRAAPWLYLTCLYQRDLANVEDYDPKVHILLEYERKTKSKSGNTIWPYGMSGCGIWFCGHPISDTPFTANHFKLVGIQNGWHKQHEYAKGTWIDIVARIIWKYFSDTRDVMRFHGIEF